jgi:hypothetical protein
MDLQWRHFTFFIDRFVWYPKEGLFIYGLSTSHSPVIHHNGKTSVALLVSQKGGNTCQLYTIDKPPYHCSSWNSSLCLLHPPHWSGRQNQREPFLHEHIFKLRPPAHFRKKTESSAGTLLISFLLPIEHLLCVRPIFESVFFLQGTFCSPLSTSLLITYSIHWLTGKII